MTRDEHKAMVNQLFGLIDPEKQATASDLLNSLSEDYEKTLTDYEGATEKAAKLTADNETLRGVNAKLFLKVGEIPGTGTKPKEVAQEQEKPPVSFDTLFNEKGELI